MPVTALESHPLRPASARLSRCGGKTLNATRSTESERQRGRAEGTPGGLFVFVGLGVTLNGTYKTPGKK